MARKALSFLLLLSFSLYIFGFDFSSAAQPSPIQSELEQKLIEEILRLESRIHALNIKLGELEEKKKELEEELLLKRSEVHRLSAKLKENREKLSRWIVFSYKHGLGTFLAVLVGAEDIGEFMRRFDNIVFLLEYYNNVVLETRNLILLRQREESSIMEKQEEIRALEEQTKKTLEDLVVARAEKEQELINARKILDDPSFLEIVSKNWQEVLPSLDYLLKNFASLPWKSIGPDNLKVNYLTLTARAEFLDKSLTEKLLSGDEKLKNAFFTFGPEGITVAERGPEGEILYSITCRLELLNDNRIRIEPIRVEFKGVTLPPKVIQDITKNVDLSFTPPPLPYDLKITSISTEDHKLIMHLKKY